MKAKLNKLKKNLKELKEVKSYNNYLIEASAEGDPEVKGFEEVKALTNHCSICQNAIEIGQAVKGL